MRGAAVARIAARREELVDSERVLRAEADGLAVAARDIAAEIRETPRVSESGRELPGTDLPELVEWGARVHAALFVVRGGLENERERIVVEANTLGAAVLGEQLAGVERRSRAEKAGAPPPAALGRSGVRGTSRPRGAGRARRRCGTRLEGGTRAASTLRSPRSRSSCDCISSWASPGGSPRRMPSARPFLERVALGGRLAPDRRAGVSPRARAR